MRRKLQKEIKVELLPANSEGLEYVTLTKSLYLKHKVVMGLCVVYVPGPEFEPQHNENK